MISSPVRNLSSIALLLTMILAYKYDAWPVTLFGSMLLVTWIICDLNDTVAHK